MGDRSVSSPPGIHWAAYSDSALLQSIKTIADELQSRAAARAAGVGQSWDAITDIPAAKAAATPGQGGKPSSTDEKKVAEPVQEWY